MTTPTVPHGRILKRCAASAPAPIARIPVLACLWGAFIRSGGAGGECPSREKPLETDACVQSTGPQQSRQRSTAGKRKTAAFQSPIELWHPTGGSIDKTPVLG